MIKPIKSQLIKLDFINRLLNLLNNVLTLQQTLRNKILKEIKEEFEDMDDQQRENFEADIEEQNELLEVSLKNYEFNIIRLFKIYHQYS